MPNVAPDFENPAGVPIGAIIFGGRTRDREPLVPAIHDVAEDVYDGLTPGARATFAAEGTVTGRGAAGDRRHFLAVDVGRRCQEMGFRQRHLGPFPGLPGEIWEARRRVTGALEA